jgi:hypothetical protein
MVKIPLIVKDRVLMKEGEANGLFYPGEVLQEAVEWLKKPLPDDDEHLAYRNRDSLFYDHDDSCETWLGEVRNYRYDPETKQIRGDLWIVDQDCADKIHYMLEQKKDQTYWGISPRLTVVQDKDNRSVVSIRPKSWALVLHPAGGKELMLSDDLNDIDSSDDELVFADLEDDEHYGTDLLKMDEDKHYVLGIVLKPDTPDSHGDSYSPEAIEEAAHEFWREYNAALVQHRDQYGRLSDVRSPNPLRNYPGVHIVDSIVLPHDTMICGRWLPAKTWLAGALIENPDIWQKVKEQKLTGFSIGGVGIEDKQSS